MQIVSCGQISKMRSEYFNFAKLDHSSPVTRIQVQETETKNILNYLQRRNPRIPDLSLDLNKLQTLEDALRETGETGNTRDTW